MIIFLILTPLIGALLLLNYSFFSKNGLVEELRIKQIALTTTVINFLFSLYLWVLFDSSTSQYQFVYEFEEISFCHFNLGVDGISLYFVLLTTFVSPVAILSNWNNITHNLKYFLVSFLVIESLQIGLFVVLDLLLFYIFFESVLPVLFIVIILYGSGEPRIRSAFLFFLYTLAGSLFMLLAVLQIYSYVGSTDFTIISLNEISLDSQKILWLAFFLAFAIKTPLWPFTGWLFRAHADSPLAGSIILAATILKFATYGFLRVLINFLPDATQYFTPLVSTIAIITLIYGSLSTIIQQDTKALIAYSSICHMAVIVLGLFSNTIQGIEGAILLGLAHGFISPGLFIIVGGIIYERTGTRVIPYIRGLATMMPVSTILFFIFTLANTGIPLSANFLGEQLALIGIWDKSPIIAVLGATGIVFSAIYSIWLYNRTSYGTYSPHLKPLKDINRREFILLITLLIPTIVFGILPNVILDGLHMSITTLLYDLNTTFPINSVYSLILMGPISIKKTNIFNNLNNRLFHSSVVLLSNVGNINNSQLEENVNIELTSEQTKQLKSGLEEINKDSDSMTAGEFLNEYTSSFGEAFPNFEKGKSWLLNKTGTAGSEGEEAVTELLKNKGITKSMELFKKDPEKYFSSEDSQGPIEKMVRNLIDFAGASCSDQTELAEVENKINNQIIIIASGKSLDMTKTIKLLDHTYTFIKDNPHFVQIGLYSGSLISYGLLLRALRNGYVKSAFPDNLNNYRQIDRAVLEKMRAKEVRAFSLFSIPLLACSLLLLGAIGSPKFTTDVLKSEIVNESSIVSSDNTQKSEGSSIVKSSFLFIMKDMNFKWVKYLIFTVLFILIIVNYCLYDLHLTYYLSSIYLFLLRNLYWIKFVMLGWIVIFIMFYILVLFKYIFLFEAKINYKSKVLPKFLLDRITDLNINSSKPELQNILIKTYFRIVLFYSLVGMLYTLLLIYS